MKISTIILVSNEKNLINCLQSCIFFEEIILIIDDNKNINKKSIIDIFKKLNFKKYQIYYQPLTDFSQQRNFALEKANNQWIFFIDDDEIISNELRKEINNLNENNKFDCFFIKRKDFFWNKELKYGELRKVYKKGLIRLIKKNSGKWIRKVHEEFQCNNKVGYLKNYLYHYPHKNIKEFLKKINFYSTLRANELFEKKHQSNILSIIFYPLGKFVYTYFIKLGFLDGVEGFVYSFVLSFYSFLTRAKLYMLNLKNNK